MKNISFKLTTLAILFTLIACDEDNPIPQVSESEIDDVTAEAYTDYAEDDVNELVIDLMDDIRLGIGNGQAANDSNRYRPFAGKVSCADISANIENKEIIIDFGAGCESADGVTRSGKIIVNFTDARHVAGAVITTSFEDFIVNGIGVEGTRTLTNVSDGSEGQRAFEIKIEEGKITFPDETFRIISSTKTRTWEIDESTREVILTVSGSAEGINRNGEAYIHAIIQDLVYKNSCRRVGTKVAVSGERSITKADLTYLISYGNGDCDNAVTITLPTGEVREVIVENRRG